MKCMKEVESSVHEVICMMKALVAFIMQITSDAAGAEAAAEAAPEILANHGRFACSTTGSEYDEDKGRTEALCSISEVP